MFSGKTGWIRAGLLSALFLFATAGCGSEESITILHFNDIHEQLMPHVVKEKDKTSESGGIARLIGTIRKQKAISPETTSVLFAGDIIQGTPFSTFFKGEITFSLLDGVVDLMVPGVHDFDYTLDNLLNLTKSAKFKIMSANILDREGKPFTGIGYVIKEINGLKVGIFGLTMRITEILQATKNIQGLTFDSIEETAKSMVTTLRGQGADFIIALTHMGVEEDKKLARAVDGINLIIGGQSHSVLTNGFLVFDTMIAQAGYRGEYLGKVTIRYDRAKKTILGVTPELIPIGKDSPADADAVKVVERYSKELKSKLDVVISKTDSLLEGSRNKVRGSETNLANLLADIMRRASGAEMCIINSGVIRASINPGPIRVADVLNVLPYPNNLATVRITGKAIYRILEKSAATNPGEGRFLQVSSGLSYKIKGRTLVEFKFNGRDIEENRTYTVATSDFLAAGGDNYPEFKQDRDPKNTGLTMAEIMIEALKQYPVVEPKIEGRIVRIEG